MTAYVKNIVVGITVLVALILLGWMILRFSDAPFRFFAKPQMPITLLASSAEGVSEGSPVYYKGVNVGRVVRISRSADQRHVEIAALVDQDPPLPRNIEGRIKSQILGGGASISLVLTNGRMNHAATSSATQPSGATTRWINEEEPRPVGALEANAQLPATFVGLDLIPKEFVELALDLQDTSRELRAIGRDFRQADIIPRVASTIDALRQDMEKAGKVLDSVQSLVSDEGMRKDLRESLANFRETSQTATQIAANLEALSRKADTRLDELAGNGNKVLVTAQGRIDDLSRQLSERITQVAQVLDNIESASRKLNEGNGSAGRLINDPALYESLLDTSREMSLVMKDFRRLVEQWEQEGMSFKLR